MMYPYMTLADETEIVHSQILDGDRVIVHFERPTENGFDSARFELPTYELLEKKGEYSNEDIEFFKKILRHNAHLFYC